MTYEDKIRDYALANDAVVVMTAENRALIRNLPSVLGNRLIDTGITEQTMIGAAAGLALRGRKPIVHALGSFLTMRAFEFIRTDLGIPGLPVKLSSFVPGFLSDGNGPTHQAIEDIGLMRGIPGMQVFSPADNEDMVGMVEAIWDSPQPAYLRVNTRPSAIAHAPYVFGKAERIQEGKDLWLLVHGMLLEEVLQTKTLLEAQGLSVGLANLRSLVPIDHDFLNEISLAGLPIFAIEDHFKIGGLYSILAEWLLDRGRMAQVHSLSLGNRWFKPGTLAEVLRHEGFTGAQLAAKVLDALGISYDKAVLLSGLQKEPNAPETPTSFIE